MTPNSSRISRPYEEDLARPADLALETRIATDPEFCQAHYLIAPGPGGATLIAAGTWRKAGRGEPKAFRWETKLAFGALKDILSRRTGQPIPAGIAGGLNIKVERSLESLFDGIDFEAGGTEEQGMRILRSTIDAARIIADLGGPASAPSSGRRPGGNPGD